MTLPDPRRAAAFRFVRCRYAGGVAELAYAFDDGPELIERIAFPDAPTLPPEREAAFGRALRLLHLIAGVSYYKAGVPAAIVVDDGPLDDATATLLEEIYRHGLGEFAYQNQLDLRNSIRFPRVPYPGTSLRSVPWVGLRPVSPKPLPDPPRTSGREIPGHKAAAQCAAGVSPSGRGVGVKVRSLEPSPGATRHPLPGGEGVRADAPALGLPRRTLVPIGGGKDSLVTVELLRAAQEPCTAVWVGNSELILACATLTGLTMLNIGREIAPLLFEYNRQGAYNGHIPVTAINSAILVLAAVLYGHDAIAFSNERSASSATLEADGLEINHQWSKGYAFERAFGGYVHDRIAADLHYFSLLRPFSELAVTRAFAALTQYHAQFSSCNRNFKLLGARPRSRWCGQCPKCHFVFLALAPFVPKPRLLAIFGRNLLDDAALAAPFDALLEWHAHKPFECVGEGRESRAAMHALAQRAEWREDALVTRWCEEIAPSLDPRELALAPLLALVGEHRIPARLQGIIDAAGRA